MIFIRNMILQWKVYSIIQVHYQKGVLVSSWGFSDKIFREEYKSTMYSPGDRNTNHNLYEQQKLNVLCFFVDIFNWFQGDIYSWPHFEQPKFLFTQHPALLDHKLTIWFLSSPFNSPHLIVSYFIKHNKSG